MVIRSRSSAFGLCVFVLFHGGCLPEYYTNSNAIAPDASEDVADGASGESCGTSGRSCQDGELCPAGFEECQGACCSLAEICTNGGCRSADSCSVSSDPPINIWSGGSADTACACPSSGQSYCHALYRGKVLSISRGADGPRANIAFSKLTGDSMSAGTQYWIGAVPSSITPSCNSLSGFTERAAGVFSKTDDQQAMDLSIWGSQSAYDNTPTGDTKCLSLVTDGVMTPGAKTWFQYEPICFTSMPVGSSELNALGAILIKAIL